MQTITVTQGDLFHLAAVYLGDNSHCIRIATQNGLKDWVLTQQVTLTIPDVNPSLGGGLPSP
jgi:hypothetical protein